MKVLVLNGSPTGKNSITLYTVLYIQKHFPECEFEILQVGAQIKGMEKEFTDCAQKLEAADLILFCYPVYTFLVPSQLHRFIELMKEHEVNVSGKYVAQISTSLHFYDITAHQFIKDNCADLSMKYLEGLSADMEDLLKEKGQKEALGFFRFLLWSMEQDKKPSSSDAGKGKLALVTDLSNDPDGRLSAMIAQFQAASGREVIVTDLKEFPFAGGCLGCFHCAADGTCVYKDGFDRYLREQIQTADAIICAFTIRDHSMGYRFKLFDDRQFCNGHRTVTMGKPFGYLVVGDLEAEPNLKVLIESRAQVGGNYLAGIAVDSEPEGIQHLVRKLDYAVENNFQLPQNFYGVGGLKIFRDLIYQMRGLMKADHQFYKKHGFYDFPQKRKGRILGMKLVGMMMRNQKLQKKMGGKMTEGMIMPYQKVLKS